MIVKHLKDLRLHRLDLLAGFFYYELGVASLQHAPTLLMGFRSVANSALLRNRDAELDNLRRACNGLSTLAALKAAAVRYNDTSLAAGHRRLFRIDERTLAIKPLFDLPSSDLREALLALKQAYEPSEHGVSAAQPGKPISIHLQYGGESRRYAPQSVPENLPKAIRHDTERERRIPVRVAWADLLSEASQMDAVDEQLQVARRGNWHQRLQAVALHSVDLDGVFSIESHLELDSLKHLIGLPGAGKTTLLVCLLRYLGLRNFKVAVFFPSIEVCRQYLEDLRRYGVHAGLLMGQSRDTRARHAHKLAEALATGDPLRGFGVSSESVPLFEGVCALPALTSAPPAAFGLSDSFCASVLQGKGSDEDADGNPAVFERRLCPAWSVCGFTRAARELPRANVWLGHVMSSDTRVPRHTTMLDERYFELIARSFDVVIFDEADRAQQDLDRGGIAELSLSGHDRSFHRQIQRSTLQPIAAGQNAVLHGVDYAQLAIEIAEFEKLNVALTHAVLRLTENLRKEFDGLLMSPLRIIGDWLSPKRLSGLGTGDFGEDPQAQAKDALCELWEGAAIRAFQLRGKRGRDAHTPAEGTARIAAAFNLSAENTLSLQTELSQLMSDWLAESSLKELSNLQNAITQRLSDVRRASTEAEAQQLVGLLLPVTFTILSYRRLSPRLSDMTEQGLIEPVKVDELSSKALLMASPDNILGSLSGVRFFSTPSQSGASSTEIDLQLQYLVFAGAPRLLMYRLHEWVKRKDGSRDGPAVLLTSATSYLPPSPASHISVTPSYVLRRLKPERDNAPPSKYAFRPIRDTQSPDVSFLRFSGEPSEALRMSSLEKMAFALLDGGPTDSQLTRDTAEFDLRDGVARRAAFVVNSYDQARRLKLFIDQRLPAWRDKVVAVVDELPASASSAGYVSSSRVESLGDDDRWQILIFPPGALGRGTNVVFTTGPRRRDAAIGTLYFLTRPHPAPNDMGLAVSMAAKATLDFDLRTEYSTSLEQLGQRLLAARRQAYRNIGRLLRRPLYARSLGKLFEPFTANMAVNLLQTIGRAMRNGCPVQCFFVDRAWAEKSAQSEYDSETSSMLVQLRRILERGSTSIDRREAALYRALYSEFLDPLVLTDGLKVAEIPDDESIQEFWTDNPMWVADAPLSEREDQ